MILGHDTIISEYKAGKIVLDPFVRENVGPNSVDVRLDSRLLQVMPNRKEGRLSFIDPMLPQVTREVIIPESGLVILPGELWLGCTIERAGSEHYVPGYEGRSTIGRMGLMSHITAGFGDVGFTGRWTLEITCIIPIMLYPGMRIGQVYFETVSDTSHRYGKEHDAHYAEQVEATAAFFKNIC